MNAGTKSAMHYYAELLLQTGKTDEAYEIIGWYILQSSRFIMSKINAEVFCTHRLEIPNQESFLEDMVKLLDDDHPRKESLIGMQGGLYKMDWKMKNMRKYVFVICWI